MSVYLLRQVRETNGLSQIEKIESIRLEKIQYTEVKFIIFIYEII